MDVQALLASGDGAEDAYEVIDPVLNNAIGYGMSVDSLVKIVRRGPWGIDGFCDWLVANFTHFSLDPILIEARLQKLCDASVIWYADSAMLIVAYS